MPHDGMRAAISELLKLQADAIAALSTPEAIAAENPRPLLQDAVGDRVDEFGSRFNSSCHRIAADLLVRGGPELSCPPEFG